MAQILSSSIGNASSSASVLLGVDLGTNHIRLGTVDSTGKVLAFRREPYPESALTDGRALANQILSVIQQMMKEQASAAPVTAVGIAFPGLVNQRSQRVTYLPHLPKLTEMNLQQE